MGKCFSSLYSSFEHIGDKISKFCANLFDSVLTNGLDLVYMYAVMATEFMFTICKKKIINKIVLNMNLENLANRDDYVAQRFSSFDICVKMPICEEIAHVLPHTLYETDINKGVKLLIDTMIMMFCLYKRYYELIVITFLSAMNIMCFESSTIDRFLILSSSILFGLDHQMGLINPIQKLYVVIDFCTWLLLSILLTRHVKFSSNNLFGLTYSFQKHILNNLYYTLKK